MARITYVQYGGARHVIDVASGSSVMEGAVRNGIAGIDADCGGACTCGTCRVDVDPAWSGRLPRIVDPEMSMLAALDKTGQHSRLSCQLKVTDGLEGLIVTLPERQE